MKYQGLTLRNRWKTALIAVVAGVFLTPASFLQGRVSAAACSAPSTDYGTASTSVNLPAAATYRVWTRIQVPDTTNNTYLLEIDGNKCYTVGGGSIQTNTWVWVSHQNGNTNSKIDVSLAQGNRSLKLIGNKSNVKIDRLVFASDTACVPTGNGDNCNAPSDTTAPTVRITSPTADAGVSGTANISATATDTTGVTKVELYVNSSLLGTDTSSPYTFSWDTTKIPNGTQLLTAKGYDAAGNVGIDSFNVKVENGDKVAPSVPSGLTATATAYNAVTVSWKASTDNTGVTGYTVYRDGLPIGNTATASYKDTGLFANTAYAYKVLAYDAAGNKSATTSAFNITTPQPPVADTQAPTKPTNLVAEVISPTQVNLSWTASTDNIGVVKYQVFRTTGTAEPSIVGTSQTASFGDPSLVANASYTYFVIALDASNNESDDSEAVTIKTKELPKKRPTVKGIIREASSSTRLSYSSVSYTSNGSRHISQANSRGRYAIQYLEPASYNMTYRASKHYSQTHSVVLGDITVTKNVSLQKR